MLLDNSITAESSEEEILQREYKSGKRAKSKNNAKMVSETENYQSLTTATSLKKSKNKKARKQPEVKTPTADNEEESEGETPHYEQHPKEKANNKK